MNFEDDMDEMARLGWDTDKVDELARIGFAPGALAAFMSLESETRTLVLRLLDSPTDSDFAALASHPAGRSLAEWLLTLPAFANGSGSDGAEETRSLAD